MEPCRCSAACTPSWLYLLSRLLGDAIPLPGRGFTLLSTAPAPRPQGLPVFYLHGRGLSAQQREVGMDKPWDPLCPSQFSCAPARELRSVIPPRGRSSVPKQERLWPR